MKNIQTLKFWAPWCKPCSVLSSQLEDFEITSINIDEQSSADLVKQYGIRNIPMLVFLVDGEEKRRIGGVISKEMYNKTLHQLKNDIPNVSEDREVFIPEE
jgi:thioredoxin-like negative regulator of GroEL